MPSYSTHLRTKHHPFVTAGVWDLSSLVTWKGSGSLGFCPLVSSDHTAVNGHWPVEWFCDASIR